MEQPMIIWTLRRTGGTSLASLLFKNSSFKGLQHEPFNQERVWGDVTYDWRQQEGKALDDIAEYDLSSIQDRIFQYVSSKRNIKHCIDNIPFTITKFLLEASQDVGYKHILLLRKNQLQRILSLLVAQQVTWKHGYSPDVAAEKIESGEFVMPEIAFGDINRKFIESSQIVGRLYEAFHQNDIPYYRVYFEDLYSSDLGAQERVQNAMRILDYLEIENRDTTIIQEKIFNASEHTQAIYEHIPNYAQLESLMKFYGIN